MTYSDFLNSLKLDKLPDFNIRALSALWLDGKGNWEDAHELAQEITGSDGAWIHAYLHRKEGDDWNARYWYDCAGKSYPLINLEKEFEQLVRYFLTTN
ncbi:MAG: hypothetical protein RLZZ241_2437 [Bacteroidota bacterium]|jgi:hypothetical protein